jgi:hypothetical protein
MMDDGSIINHDEALQLAFTKQAESNLARCYIDLRKHRPYGMTIKADKELEISVSENGKLLAGPGLAIISRSDDGVVANTEIRFWPPLAECP